VARWERGAKRNRRSDPSRRVRLRKDRSRRSIEGVPVARPTQALACGIGASKDTPAANEARGSPRGEARGEKRVPGEGRRPVARPQDERPAGRFEPDEVVRTRFVPGRGSGMGLGARGARARPRSRRGGRMRRTREPSLAHAGAESYFSSIERITSGSVTVVHPDLTRNERSHEPSKPRHRARLLYLYQGGAPALPVTGCRGFSRFGATVESSRSVLLIETLALRRASARDLVPRPSAVSRKALPDRAISTKEPPVARERVASAIRPWFETRVERAQPE